jgi:hypothetical protein
VQDAAAPRANSRIPGGGAVAADGVHDNVLTPWPLFEPHDLKHGKGNAVVSQAGGEPLSARAALALKALPDQDIKEPPHLSGHLSLTGRQSQERNRWGMLMRACLRRRWLKPLPTGVPLRPLQAYRRPSGSFTDAALGRHILDGQNLCPTGGLQ